MRTAVVRLMTLSVIFILSAIASNALAQNIRNVSGDWTCEGACQVPGGGCHIDQDGANLTCRNEVTETVEGRMLTANRLTCWGLNGTLSGDGRAINWHNGTYWVKPPRWWEH
jgi:hypothetical protein